jgi:hypothetical protein
MFYPPLPVYPQHQPPFPMYGGTSSIQPWGYARYSAEQVAELRRRFPVNPLAIEHAGGAFGDGRLHGDEARGNVANGPVDQELRGREDVRVGGARANVAAPVEKQYPNDLVGTGGQFHSHLRTVKHVADCLNLKSGNSRST